MKVHELVAHLAEFDPMAEVFLSKDPEGNLFREIETADWEWFDYTNDIADCKTDPSERVRRVVVLWPH